MELYLDLIKAGQMASSGTTAKKEDQAVASDAESYLERRPGVANEGSAGYDDPDHGKKWTHGGETLDDKVEQQRQARNKKAQDRNLVPSDEEAGLKKAFEDSSLDMIKSLDSGLRNTLGLNTLSQTEVDFLHLVKGYSHEDISRGRVAITGRDRQLFSSWLCDRVQKSLDGLYRR